MSLKYLYLIENVDNDLICLLMITKIICLWWFTIASWIMFVAFEIKPFVDLSVCIKKWTYKISAIFHSLTKRLETGTRKTRKPRDQNSSDRNGSDQNSQTEKSYTRNNAQYEIKAIIQMSAWCEVLLTLWRLG